MKFCDYCENMLYVSVEDELLFRCKNCNFVKVQDKPVDGSSIPVLHQNYAEGKDAKPKEEGDECIMDINYADDTRSYKQFITKNIKYDPTLPHVNNIPCTNAECRLGKGDTANTIYIKYDHVNMKYLYFCCHCEHFWRL